MQATHLSFLRHRPLSASNVPIKSLFPLLHRGEAELIMNSSRDPVAEVLSMLSRQSRAMRQRARTAMQTATLLCWQLQHTQARLARTMPLQIAPRRPPQGVSLLACRTGMPAKGAFRPQARDAPNSIQSLCCITYQALANPRVSHMYFLVMHDMSWTALSICV